MNDFCARCGLPLDNIFRPCPHGDGESQWKCTMQMGRRPRQERWDRHYLQLCLDHARMSKDPSTQVGSVIIGPDREPISDGFNGFPRGIQDSAERLGDRDLKLKLMVHAEMNALMNAVRMGHATKGATLYLGCTDSSGLTWGGPPCTRCTVHIIQAGIVEVVSFPEKPIPSKWHEDIRFARELLSEAGILYRELQ